jgi:tRNA pseudouridine38-40 synthase
VDVDRLAAETAVLAGEHTFRAFAVRGTAPEHDDHRCVMHEARWERLGSALFFFVEANRFLHHMVRFLVGTLLDVASGRREAGTVARLLEAANNSDVSPPAPAHALFLERVTYPDHLYLPSST